MRILAEKGYLWKENQVNFLELKNKISEIKIYLATCNSSLDTEEDKISEFRDTSIRNIQSGEKTK